MSYPSTDISLDCVECPDHESIGNINILVPPRQVNYERSVSATSVLSDGGSDADKLDTANDASEQPISKRLRMALFLEKFRRRRDTFIRMSLFGRRIPVPFWERFDGRYSVAEAVCLLMAIGITIGYSVYAVVVLNPVIPRQLAQWALMICLTLATHNSVLNLILGISFDRRLFWHKLMSLSTNILGWTHGILAIVKWGILAGDNTDRRQMMFCGLSLSIVLTAFIVLSGPAVIRRKLWNCFHVMHLTLTVLMVAAACVHKCYFSLIGIALLLIDVVVRYVYMAVLAHPNCAEIRSLPSKIVRFTMPKPPHFHYEAGQYVFLMIPQISLYEWHPFTLSSSPHTNLLTVHVRGLGDWTNRVLELAKKEEASASSDGDVEQQTQATLCTSVMVYLEGPYGSPEINVFGSRYKNVLLFGAGIGITPIQSIGNHLLHLYGRGKRNLNRIRFVWCTPDTSMFKAVFEDDRQWAGYLNQMDPFPQLEPIITLEKSKSGTRKRAMSKVSSVGTIDGRLAPSNGGSHQRQDSSYSTATSASSIASMCINNCDDVLRRELYVTRMKTQKELDESDISPEIKEFVRLGRPDYEQIFNKSRNEAIAFRRKRIAVIVCGPKQMVQNIRHLCARYNAQPHSTVKFDFHAELFEF